MTLLAQNTRRTRVQKRSFDAARHVATPEARARAAALLARLSQSSAENAVTYIVPRTGAGGSGFVVKWAARQGPRNRPWIVEKSYPKPLSEGARCEVAFYSAPPLQASQSRFVAIPTCHDVVETDDSVSLFLGGLRRRNGRNRSPRHFGWGGADRITRALAHFNALADVNREQADLFAREPSPIRISPRTLRRVRLLALFGFARPVHRRMARLLIRLYEARLELLGTAAAKGQVLSHCDINRGNVWAGLRRRPVVLLDFESCAMTPPGVDLGSYLANCGHRLIERVDSNEDFRDRLDHAIATYHAHLTGRAFDLNAVNRTVRLIMLMQGIKRGTWWTSSLPDQELWKRFLTVYEPLESAAG